MKEKNALQVRAYTHNTESNCALLSDTVSFYLFHDHKGRVKVRLKCEYIFVIVKCAAWAPESEFIIFLEIHLIICCRPTSPMCQRSLQSVQHS